MITLGAVLKEGIPIILINLLITVAIGRLSKRFTERTTFKLLYVMSWLATIFMIIVICVKAVQTWEIP